MAYSNNIAYITWKMGPQCGASAVAIYVVYTNGEIRLRISGAVERSSGKGGKLG